MGDDYYNGYSQSYHNQVKAIDQSIIERIMRHKERALLEKVEASAGWKKDSEAEAPQATITLDQSVQQILADLRANGPRVHDNQISNQELLQRVREHAKVL